MKQVFSLAVLVSLTATVVLAQDPLQPAPAQNLGAPVMTDPGLRVGPVDLHPRITTGVTYDDNILLSNNSTNRLQAFITAISPELTAGLGNKPAGRDTWLTLNYRPTFLIFSDHTDNNTVDHSAGLTAQWMLTKLTLGVSQEYNQTHGAMVEVGQRFRQDSYRTTLLARYAFSEKTSLEISPRLTIQDNEDFLSSRDWGVDLFLNRALGAKLIGGLGGSIGLFTIDNSPDQYYERGLARLTYAVAAKADVIATVGIEGRQYDGSQSSKLQPVLGLAGVYRPWETASFTIEAHRREEASVTQVAQNYVTTGGSAQLRQGLGERFFVSVGGSYDYRSYSENTPGVIANRTDKYYTIRTAAGTTITRRGAVNVFYQYQSNASTGILRDFRNNQIGIQGSWGF
ncbi:MAG: hypothetical protein PCFJNLEI_02240 [Verrucomicrobiae bacterium]|nr:hypothetical protein [Verrucomicrobiae bacterium]